MTSFWQSFKYYLLNKELSRKYLISKLVLIKKNEWRLKKIEIELTKIIEIELKISYTNHYLYNHYGMFIVRNMKMLPKSTEFVSTRAAVKVKSGKTAVCILEFSEQNKAAAGQRSCVPKLYYVGPEYYYSIIHKKS